MTREKAVEVVKALNDIEDFERFKEEVEKLYHESEGDLAKFFNNQMVPAMEAELARRQLVLEQM
jgi:hypothetical protein